MKSHDDSLAQPKDLEQLLRLRQVQVDKAQAQLRVGRLQRDEASRVVEESMRKVHDDVANVRRFAEYIVGEGAPELARLGSMFNGYRAHLNDTLAASQAGLTKNRERLEDAEEALAELQAQWLREMARRDAVESSLRRSRAAEVRETERLAEAELEELQSGRVAGVAAMPAAASVAKEARS
jgi:hypothetical protein